VHSILLSMVLISHETLPLVMVSLPPHLFYDIGTV
jgi:hypothetical protein